MTKESFSINMTYCNDTYFSLSRDADGLRATGHVTQEELEKFIKAYYIDVLEIVNKLKEIKL